ncbi:MAG: hypothetical protein R3B70_30705 [Polyangiaceae bacterium]
METETAFGDFPISGSCATIDGTTKVPIYELTPGSDGSYTLQAAIIAWKVGGGGARYFLQMNWTVIDGVIAVDGSVFSSANGSLSPVGLAVDTSAGKGRVLVTGIDGEPLLWRLRGVRFDLAA